MIADLNFFTGCDYITLTLTLSNQTDHACAYISQGQDDMVALLKELVETNSHTEYVVGCAIVADTLAMWLSDLPELKVVVQKRSTADAYGPHLIAKTACEGPRTFLV